MSYSTKIHELCAIWPVERKQNVHPITTDSIFRAELLLLSIINTQHWTLLVRHTKLGVWYFYDSLPNPTHKIILPQIIKLLVQDVGHSFESNPMKWPIKMMSGVLVQANIVDYGMFICKYMEAVIRKPPLNWTDHHDWSKKKNCFRAEFAYAIFCVGMKNIK